MKNILKGLWNFINSKVFGYILILIIAIFFFGTCQRNSDLKDKIKRKDQNISALNDSIKQEIQKNGNLQVSIDGYIATNKELREYNKDLADRVKAQKGQVITLNRIVFRLKNDSTELAKRVDELEKKLNEPIQLNDSTWNLGWTAAYKGIGTISGNSIVGVRADRSWLKDIKLSNEDIIISSIDIPVEMEWGQKWVKENGQKRLKVFAQTDYPGFHTKLLEGTYVDYPKEEHWFTGFGIGPNFGMGYDFLNNRPAFTIGVGLHYNVYRW